MKTQTNVGAWIGTLVMGVVAFGVLTVEEGDMLMRAVATAATAIIGAALIVAEAWKGRTATPAEEGEVGVTEIVLESVTFDLSPEELEALAKKAYEAHVEIYEPDGTGVRIPWQNNSPETKSVWMVMAEVIVNEFDAALQEVEEASSVEDILRTFSTRDLVQALTQCVGVERRNLPLDSEDGPAILLKIVD